MKYILLILDYAIWFAKPRKKWWKNATLYLPHCPHGLSQELAAACSKRMKFFIDLGADFRLEDEETYKTWYGCDFLDKSIA